eukprot:CAMPEP_0178975182 /NCGR_PEP_ID=MMETSP0789-20121207/22977_1 /TAXON_ID=3005 /ORGANISM="Rhizosolenia setigera, Strain CCMP 1694" /LENGTH=691 /DNA_ID=CAMNT_0020663813 /DNA_START=1947 /DNA_END=4022 /DNA_ORIENTATION=+
MALPNVISALCLTEKGAKAVKEFNPFPSLLSIFYNRDYVMPLNSCLLNDMASIFGSALDELMRHVPSVRKIGIDAIVNAIQRIVQIGKSLQEKEKSSTKSVGKELEDERTCLMQYAYNICQLLESVVHCEDHVGPFVEAKGFEPLIELFPLLMSSNEQFLAHVSCLSNPATSHITHSTTTKVITSVIRSIAQQFSSHLLIRKVVSCIDVSLTSLEQKQKELRILGNTSSVENNISAENILNAVPDVPLHDSEISNNLSRDISSYFHSVITTEWLMNILSTIIRAACNKGNADSWISSPNRDQWKKELSSDSFSGMMKRLCTLHHSAIMEVCRVRVASTSEDPLLEKPPSIYRLRIVCNEGAVVRDGIEIDSCNNIGSLQMGEIVDAYDRCINSSGVMRYNTSRGWVSEQTRGHDREPIAEVISISDEEPTENNLLKDEKNKRIECSVPNLRSVCASMLCRLQNSQKIFFSCLSRAIIHGVRAGASSRTGLSNPGVHAGAMINYVTCHIRQGLDAVKDKLSDDSELALYLSNIIELLHVCICDEKRERRILNIPLLLSVSALDSVLDDEGQGSLPVSGIFGAIRFVLKFNLNEMAKFSSSENHRDILINLLKEPPSTFHEKAISSSFKNQRLSKAAAASLPPTLHFLRRLCSRSLLVESQLSTLLNRMKYTDLTNILGEDAVKHYTVQDKNK